MFIIKLADTNDVHCTTELQRFVEENASLFEHKVVKNFLKDENHQQLLKDAICYPSKQHDVALDLAFKKYYFNARFTTYISKTFYFYALNFDKAHRTRNERYTLMMDKPMKEENGATFKELLEDTTVRVSLDEMINSYCMEDHVESASLYEAVTKLSKKQKEVIDLYYVRAFSEKQIGRALNKSQQVVSKLHRKALANICRYMQCEGGSS
ncbi:sigma-70 family RNA polymerase sigma factor [Gracilibacillus caseinilyticus]|uniref:Sigma-70 family RNA polymerase sigma factor n=1 Tax=Gracilibacillus caseinilyticus TaxID=2932256 RepID=A0ABY4EYR3_9BACI|nr:sigma-70 family RNA polymerase sigma factor [Gracilibacillus caseinilyticus]UOQ49414.1 sigma-70 family RNA polymerase sigma factor [Gracilibacillus caseinilyticus]